MVKVPPCQASVREHRGTDHFRSNRATSWCLVLLLWSLGTALFPSLHASESVAQVVGAPPSLPAGTEALPDRFEPNALLPSEVPLSYQDMARALHDGLTADLHPRKAASSLEAASPNRHLYMPLELAHRFYAHSVSSQDGATCGFTPSCSGFAVQALHRFGPIHGLLLTVDRLQRDHPQSGDHYPMDASSGLSLDPVESYCRTLPGICP